MAKVTRLVSTPAFFVQLPLDVQKPALGAEGPRRLGLRTVRVPGYKVHVQHQASLVVAAEQGEGQFLERGVEAVFWPFFSLGGLGRAGGPGARTERRGSARNPDLLRHAGVPVLPSGAPSGSGSSRLPPGGPAPPREPARTSTLPQR